MDPLFHRSAGLALFVGVTALAACAAPQSPPLAPVATVTTPPPPPPSVSVAPPVPSSAPVAARPPSEPALDDVIADATTRGVPILLVFHTVWCKPCVELETNVLTKPAVVTALADFRVQKYDAELGSGGAAAERFHVSSYPTLLVLSPKGAEIGRLHEQDVEGVVRAVTAIKPAALHSPIADADVAHESDARTLLVTGQMVERDGDVERARRAYRAAIKADKGATKEFAGPAAFAIMRIESRAQDLKNHGKALLAFAADFPASTEALRVIDGLTVLPPSARPERAALRKTMASVVLAQRRAQGKPDWALRQLASSLTALDDPEDAAKAVAGLPAPASDAPPSVAPPKADPLGAEVSHGPPPEFAAMWRRESLLGRTVAEACGAEPRTEPDEEVRLTIKDGRVERALLLDPEASDSLRRCIEGAFATEVDLPALFGARHVLTVRFSPAH